MKYKEQIDLKELVNAYIPDDMEFPETPMRSAESMREAARQELNEALQMREFNEMINVGLESLYAFADEQLLAHERVSLLSNIEEVKANLNEKKSAKEDAVTYAELVGLTNETLSVIDRTGEYYYLKREFDKAAGIYTMLAMMNHLDAGIWSRKGLAMQALRKWEEALACFNISSELAPEDPGPHLLAARCSLEAGNESEAKQQREEGRKLIQANPAYESIWADYL